MLWIQDDHKQLKTLKVNVFRFSNVFFKNSKNIFFLHIFWILVALLPKSTNFKTKMAKKYLLNYLFKASYQGQKHTQTPAFVQKMARIILWISSIGLKMVENKHVYFFSLLFLKIINQKPRLFRCKHQAHCRVYLAAYFYFHCGKNQQNVFEIQLWRGDWKVPETDKPYCAFGYDHLE